MLMLESGAEEAALAITLISRLARGAEDSTIHWEDLPVCDLNAIMVRIRQMVFGDLLKADVSCPSAECGKLIDLAFSVGQYLDHHAPRPVRIAEPASESGWMRLRG